jgi:hypothetical protein
MREFGGLVVSDRRRKRGDEHQRAVHELGDPLLVGLGALDQVLAEVDRAVRQELDRWMTLTMMSGL